MKLLEYVLGLTAISLFTMAGVSYYSKNYGFKYSFTSKRLLSKKKVDIFDAASLTEFRDGSKLAAINVRGLPLHLMRGAGNTFGYSQVARFEELKRQAQGVQSNIQWSLANLDSGKVLNQSASAGKIFYGASVTKILVGGAFLQYRKGVLSRQDRQILADMVVVSSNSAWSRLQKLVGDGADSLGQKRVQGFSQSMGLNKTRAFKGWQLAMHGNETSAAEMTVFLGSIYHQKFAGASDLWKIMHATRTGQGKAGKYLPTHVIYGGKTGTYSGYTQHPESRNSYRAAVKHHTFTFRLGGVQYGMTIMSDGYTNEDVAIIAGGVLRDELPLDKPAS